MKKVIVIGGGFAGSAVAKELEKDFEVTLIDTKDFFEFTPGIMRAIVNSDYVKEIQVLHSRYLRKANVVIGEVKRTDEKNVRVNGGGLGFDYLVICSGSRYESPFKEQKVVIATRADNLKNRFEDLKKAKRVVIVGGGPVGVELAGEILDKYSDKELTIVHSGEKLIERNSAKAIAYAERHLRKKGVRIIFGEKVVEMKKGVCITDKGTKVKGDVVFLCTGIKPNYEFLKDFDDVLDERNHVKVNEFLQVNGFENIFAAGDITAIKEEKTAQNAEREAEIVVKNIRALESGRELKKYESKRTPQVISLGKWDGIYDNGKIVITGVIPAFLKWAVKKREMWKKR